MLLLSAINFIWQTSLKVQLTPKNVQGREGKNVQAMKILGFYSSGKAEIEELLDGSLLRSDFSQVSILLSPFSFFSTSVIEIEVLNEEDCSLLSMLYCESLQKYIFLAFCNNFFTITLLHVRIHSS